MGQSRVELGVGISFWSPGLYEDVTVTFEQMLHCLRVNDVQPPHDVPVRNTKDETVQDKIRCDKTRQGTTGQDEIKP